MKLSGKLYQTNSINFEIFCSIDLSHRIFFDDIDSIKNNYKFILCDDIKFSNIDKDFIIGSKKSKWGIEAIVKSDFVPEGVETRPVDIEQLFLFMAREKDYR